MIESKRGNILAAEAEALVNPVNCVGVMGRGLALQFRKAHPDNFSAYELICKQGGLLPGGLFTFATNCLTNPRYIINFATKDHWKGKSRVDYIETGLRLLVEEVRKLNLHSLAIPPLGCGLGGLKWEAIKPRIESAFIDLPQVEVLLYEPQEPV